MSLPAQVLFGTVIGSNFAAIVDGSDLDVDPDSLALEGQVTFTPDLVAGQLLVTTATPPVTVTVEPVPVSPASGAYSVKLVATDIADAAPATWTWTATFNLYCAGARVTIPSVTFLLPAGTTVDMTLAAPVPTADGWQAYASVAASAAAAAASAASAALSASLVGAPADSAIAAVMGNGASESRVVTDALYSLIGASLVQSPGKNMFDLAAASLDHYWGGATTPAPYPLVGHQASTQIPVVAGATYTIQKARNIQAFDGAGVYTTALAYNSNATLANVTITIPASGVAFIGISTPNANVPLMQMELGAIATSYEPYGVKVQNLLANGAYLDAQLAAFGSQLSSVPIRKTQGLTVIALGTEMALRYSADATRDIVEPFSLSHANFANMTPMVMYQNSTQAQVYLVPSATSDASVFPTIAAGVTASNVAGQGDDNAPIYADWSYVGGNHGWFGATTVTMTAHGKTNADRGSQWSDGTRTYTLLKVIDANNVLIGHQYTVSSGIVTGSTIAPAATLTHVSGATNTASITIVGGAVAGPIHPATHTHVVSALLDGKPIRDGSTAGEVLTVTETYTIVSFKALIDYSRANIGADPFANIAALGAHSRVSNTYRITALGKVISQTATALEATQPVIICTQAMPVAVPSGGTLEQFIPGVGTVNGCDFRTFAPVASLTGDTTIVLANQLTAGDPPNRMIQWAKDSGGVRAWGQMIGILPVMDGKPATRKSNGTDTNGWFIDNSTKKNYPRISVSRLLAIGDTVTASTFRRYLTPDAPPEQVITDGARYWVTIDQPAANASKVIARTPRITGRALTVIGTATVTPDRTFVTGEGITYTNSAPGYLLAEAIIDSTV